MILHKINYKNEKLKTTNLLIDKNYSKEEVIDYLCKGESFSNHPIAKSILNLNKDFDNNDVKDFEEISGLGIKFKIKDHELAIGNRNLCACEYDSSIHLNIDGKHIASIIIDDGLKDEALSTIEELNDMNIETIIKKKITGSIFFIYYHLIYFTQLFLF